MFSHSQIQTPPSLESSISVDAIMQMKRRLEASKHPFHMNSFNSPFWVNIFIQGHFSASGDDL